MRRLTAIIQRQSQVVFLSDEEPLPRCMRIAYICELFGRARLLIPQHFSSRGREGGENKAYRYHLLGKSYASSKRHITNLFLAQALDASDRIEFDRSLGQINSELDRLNVVPRETIEPDRWSEELQAIGRTLNEIDNSE